MASIQKKINILHHRLISQYHAFHRMDNLFRSFIGWLLDEKSKNSGFVGGGMFLGWLISIFTLLHSPGLGVIFSWEFVIKTLGGIIIAVITAAAVKGGVSLTDDIYKVYIKPKFFKDDKRKKDNRA